MDNGKNVYPEEIETDIINNIDYIKEIVVYQADVKDKNQVKTCICAGVFLDSETAPDVNEVKKDFLRVNQMLAVYKRIAYVDIVDSEYEKTSTRKIKRDLAEKRHTMDKGIII